MKVLRKLWQNSGAKTVICLLLLTVPCLGQEGKASWYGPGFNGRRTASGEIFDSRAYTAAHKTLPLGSTITVENLDTGKWMDLRITDRGPFVKGRILDVSEGAAKFLGIKGLANVRITKH